MAEERYLNKMIEGEVERRKNLKVRIKTRDEVLAKEKEKQKAKIEKQKEEEQLKQFLESKVAEEMEGNARDAKSQKLVNDMLEVVNNSPQDFAKPMAKVLGNFQGIKVCIS